MKWKAWHQAVSADRQTATKQASEQGCLGSCMRRAIVQVTFRYTWIWGSLHVGRCGLPEHVELLAEQMTLK